jgi:Electron transfer DM13
MKNRFTIFPFLFLVVSISVLASDIGPFVGATATLSTIEEGVSGTATVIDAQTIQVEHFYYEGGRISVFFRLGTNDTKTAFGNGISLGDQLVTHSYTNATLTLSLPAGQSLEGYNAISVYCVSANVDFGSGAFIAPAPPQLSDIQHIDGITSVVLTGEIGKRYELQASTNLLTWVDLYLATNTDGMITLTDTNLVEQRYYRAVVK